MLDSNLTKCIMAEEPQHGVESERAPRTHWIAETRAERNKENDKEHRNQPITTESGLIPPLIRQQGSKTFIKNMLPHEPLSPPVADITTAVNKA